MIWEFTTTISPHEELKQWKSKQSGKKKLAEKRAKKQAKSGPVSSKEDKSIPLDQVITLDHLTNPDKK